MSKHIDQKHQIRIATHVMGGLSCTEAGEKFGISRQRAQQITRRQLPNLFLPSELEKDHDIKRLRRVFNRWRM